MTSCLHALRDGHIAGAGLDVTEPEPLPSDHPLWRAAQRHHHAAYLGRLGSAERETVDRDA